MARAVRLSTYSIVACDLARREWGVAVQSKFLAVGSLVGWAEAEVGAVATQAFANPRYGPEGLALARDGLSAEQVVERLTSADPGRDDRQLGVIDAAGQGATFTGSGCFEWAGGRTGPGYAAQGNILVSQATVDALAETFESSTLAATMAGASMLAVECSAQRIEMRLRTRYLDTQAGSLDEALTMIERSCRERKPISVGLLGNAAEIFPELVRRGVKPNAVTDQTSAHDPLNGYLPAGWSLAEWEDRRARDPKGTVEAAKRSMAVQVEAMLDFWRAGVPTLDYGNKIGRAS